MGASASHSRDGSSILVAVLVATTFFLCLIVAAILFVEIDSNEVVKMGTVYPTVDGLRLRMDVPMDLSQNNILRNLGAQEALLVLDEKDGVKGKWLKVKSLAKGDEG